MDFSSLDSGVLTISKRGPQYPAGIVVKLENAKAADSVSDLNALWNDLRPLILGDAIVSAMTAGFTAPSGVAPDEDVTLALSRKTITATLRFTPTEATLAATPAKPAAVFGAPVGGVRPPPVTPRFVPSAGGPPQFFGPPPAPAVLPTVPLGEFVTRDTPPPVVQS